MNLSSLFIAATFNLLCWFALIGSLNGDEWVYPLLELAGIVWVIWIFCFVVVPQIEQTCRDGEK